MTTASQDAGDTKRGGQDSGRSIALQWFGVLAPPTAWLLNLEFGYALTHAACHGSGMLPLHLASIAAVALAVAGGAASFATWRRSGRTWPNDSADVPQRSRMLAVLGLGSAAFFLLVIVTQWISAFVLNPCWLT